MTGYIDCSHNVLRTMDKNRWDKDLAKSDKADITGYQEAGASGVREVIKAYCGREGRALYHPTSCGNPISWKRSVFTEVRIREKLARGVINSHLGASQMGVPARMNPARDFTYVGLRHRESSKTVLRINVHTTAHGVMAESSPANTDSVAASKWKDWAIGQYWLDVLSFVAGQMSLQDPGRETTTSLWDVVSIGGDYNGQMTNRARWYYPGSLLPAVFVADRKPTGLDHLQHGHGSDVTVDRRWSVPGYTDHSIHFVQRTFANVTDFPRQ